MPTNYADVSLNVIRPVEDEGARQLNELMTILTNKIFGLCAMRNFSKKFYIDPTNLFFHAKIQIFRRPNLDFVLG